MEISIILFVISTLIIISLLSRYNIQMNSITKRTNYLQHQLFCIENKK